MHFAKSFLMPMVPVTRPTPILLSYFFPSYLWAVRCTHLPYPIVFVFSNFTAFCACIFLSYFFLFHSSSYFHVALKTSQMCFTFLFAICSSNSYAFFILSPRQDLFFHISLLSPHTFSLIFEPTK